MDPLSWCVISAATEYCRNCGEPLDWRYRCSLCFTDGSENARSVALRSDYGWISDGDMFREGAFIPIEKFGDHERFIGVDTARLERLWIRVSVWRWPQGVIESLQMIRRPTKKQLDTLMQWCQVHDRALPADVVGTYTDR